MISWSGLKSLLSLVHARTSLFYRIFILTTAVMLFALILSASYSMRKFSTSMERQMSEHVSNVLEQTNKLIDARLEALLRTSNFIAKEDAVMQILQESHTTPTVTMEKRVRDGMDKVIQTDPGIVSSFVLSRERKLFVASKDVRMDASGLEQLKSRYWELGGGLFSRGMYWMKTHPIDYSSTSIGQEANVFKLVRDIFDDNIIYLGTIVVNVKEESIYDAFRRISLPDRAIFYVMDKNGIIISGSERQNVGKFEYSYTFMQALLQKQGSFMTDYRGEPHLFVFNKLENMEWVTICAIPVGEMLRERDTIMRAALWILCLLIVLSVGSSLLIAYSISKPVKKLITATKEVRSGNFRVQAEVSTSDELGELGVSFNTMVGKINELMLQLQESHTKEKEAEIRALQSQINPHFLYNTLSAVVWLAESKDYEKITDIITKLGRYYRQSLSKGMDIVKIKQELEHAEHYLAIEQIRYGNQFSYEFEVDSGVWNYPCLKLILQPLVENALHHGILQSSGTGRIVITGGFQEEHIVLRVEDNGAGISEERLAEINHHFQSGHSRELSGSYGIKNVNERLQLKYGQRYGLVYRSVAGQGTIVEVHLPK